MKVKELLEVLSDAKPDDNITFYYMENNTLTNSTFESFFDCNYEDVNGVVDWELTVQNTMEHIEDNAEQWKHLSFKKSLSVMLMYT